MRGASGVDPDVLQYFVNVGTEGDERDEAHLAPAHRADQRATLLEWQPWLLAFVAAAMVDGYLVRSIKAKEFLHHDPELFALYASGAIVAGCATVLAFVLPVDLHPLVLPCVPLVIGVLISRAVGSFHRRG